MVIAMEAIVVRPVHVEVSPFSLMIGAITLSLLMAPIVASAEIGIVQSFPHVTILMLAFLIIVGS